MLTDMKTSTHIYNLHEVKVTPTMEALGDQPFICEVRRLADDERETFTVESVARFTAAISAVERFKAKHPQSDGGR